MCGCLRVEAYIIGCLKIRALLDQHSHRLHVSVLTRLVRLNKIMCEYFHESLDWIGLESAGHTPLG
jgi:hypothetical protein